MSPSKSNVVHKILQLRCVLYWTDSLLFSSSLLSLLSSLLSVRSDSFQRACTLVDTQCLFFMPVFSLVFMFFYYYSLYLYRYISFDNLHMFVDKFLLLIIITVINLFKFTFFIRSFFFFIN